MTTLSLLILSRSVLLRLGSCLVRRLLVAPPVRDERLEILEMRAFHHVLETFEDHTAAVGNTHTQ